MISFIVPAHNEQAVLGRTLQAIHDSARIVGQPYEIIVVDDASTDATAEVARQHNAIIVSVNHRQIAATRNSGGRAAGGDRLLFVDADTTINPRVLASALRAMEKGAAGGGAPAQFEGKVPLYMRLLIWWLGWFMRLGGICGGAFMFCTRKAFNAVGGFDERLFGAEDAAMSWALKREGRFVVLWGHVLTSGRRVRGMRGLQMLMALLRMAFFPSMLRQRSSVKKVWYESNRVDDDKTPDSLAMQIINIILLLIIVLWIAGPLLGFVPWSWTPRESLSGKIRIGFGIFNCHIGLIAWPCAYFLIRSLLIQTRWLERMKLTALAAISLWCAWSATGVVIWFWPWFILWLVGCFKS
ncbi:glycosyltransferase [Pedosphaera parvula]|uniref:Glycosyl transferase family 2 n=1 Tax=Pedosphaera parvula (strain Ellin514) TaxID=320771 RepID=B9XJ23_PEDPL|nr:glycosyltransferase [Pedosphaera parvula]EEF60250.1 glycosyl transferase family 2 [Pedosphaera parvula Ellin514]